MADKLVKAVQPLGTDSGDGSQSLPDPKRELAAIYLAKPRMMVKTVAAKVGVNPETISAWKREPAIQARVAYHFAIEKQSAQAYGVAGRDGRLLALQDLWESLTEIRMERAADEEIGAAPGGKTGFIKKVVRNQYGRSTEGQQPVEYQFDDSLFQRCLMTLEHIAKELGEWQDKSEIKHDVVTRNFNFDPDDV